MSPNLFNHRWSYRAEQENFLRAGFGKLIAACMTLFRYSESSVIPENPSRTNGQLGHLCRITLPIARSGDAGRRVPEIRPPYPGLADAPPAGSVRSSVR
jgi:hypothetical protein